MIQHNLRTGQKSLEKDPDKLQAPKSARLRLIWLHFLGLVKDRD